MQKILGVRVEQCINLNCRGFAQLERDMKSESEYYLLNCVNQLIYGHIHARSPLRSMKLSLGGVKW